MNSQAGNETIRRHEESRQEKGEVTTKLHSPKDAPMKDASLFLVLAITIGCSVESAKVGPTVAEFKQGGTAFIGEIRDLLKTLPTEDDREKLKGSWDNVLKSGSRLLPVPKMKDSDIATDLLREIERVGNLTIAKVTERITNQKLGKDEAAKVNQMDEKEDVELMSKTCDNLEKILKHE